jgi:hypothetical protein
VDLGKPFGNELVLAAAPKLSGRAHFAGVAQSSAAMRESILPL